MIEPKLADYVRQQLHQGVSLDTLESILLKAGWNKQQISDALKEHTLPGDSSNLYQTPEKKRGIFRHSKINFIIIITVLVSIVAGLGVSVFLTLKSSPQKQVAEIFKKFSQTNDFDFEGEFSVTFKDLEAFKQISLASLRKAEETDSETFDYGVIRAKFSGRTDLDRSEGPDDSSPVNNRNERLSLNVEIETHTKINKAVFTKQTYFIDLSNINQSTFFRLNHYSGFESPDLEKITNQWIKINPKYIRIAANLPTISDISNKESPSIGVTGRNFRKIRDEIAKSRPLDLNGVREIYPLYNNINLQRYDLRLNLKNTQKLTQNIAGILSDNQTASVVLARIEQYLPELISGNFEVSADSLTLLPYNIAFSLPSGTNPNQKIFDQIFFQLSLRNFHQTKDHQPPKDYIDWTLDSGTVTATPSAQTAPAQ